MVVLATRSALLRATYIGSCLDRFAFFLSRILLHWDILKWGAASKSRRMMLSVSSLVGLLDLGYKDDSGWPHRDTPRTHMLTSHLM